MVVEICLIFCRKGVEVAKYNSGIQLDDPRGATSAMVNQDASTSASVKQNVSTCSFVGHNATVSAGSANQDVISSGSDVTSQMGISGLKHGEAKKSMILKKGQVNDPYDEDTEEDDEQAKSCGASADSAKPAVAAKGNTTSAIACDTKSKALVKGRRSTTPKKGSAKTGKDHGRKRKVDAIDEVEDMEAEEEQAEVKTDKRKLRKR